MDEAGHMRQWECIDLPDFNFSVESIEEDDPLALSPFRSTPPKPEGVEISSDSESESTEHALGPSTSRRAPPLNQLRSLLHLMHQSLSDDILNNNRNRLGLGPSTALTGVDQPISIFRSSSTSTNTSTEEEYPPPCTSTPQNLAGNSLTSFETIKKYDNLGFSPDSKAVVIHNFPHIEQTSNWDCGVSCVAMCLDPTQRQTLYSNLEFYCHNRYTGFGTSTWTIDLCYLLNEFSIDHKMYTVSLGVDPSLRKESFYSSILDRDTERVRQRFQDANIYGIEVEESKLLIENILEFIKTHGPLIVLVNANLLACTDCSSSILTVCRKVCCVRFQGHYVLVIGYNLMRGIIHYRNPGVSNKICHMPIEDFDLARTSFGTDYDAIVIRDMGKANEPTEAEAEALLC